MRATPPVSLPLVLSLLAACGASCGPSGGSDAALDSYCPLVVEVGPSSDSFVPFADGDSAQVVLGFQGFQMVILDVHLPGVTVSRADVSATLEVVGSAITANRTERGVPVEARGDGVLVDGFLLFFNDAPLAELSGREADLEIVVRAGGCVGGARVRLRLSDRPPCIDPTTQIPDVAARDAGALPDGSVLCEAP